MNRLPQHVDHSTFLLEWIFSQWWLVCTKVQHLVVVRIRRSASFHCAQHLCEVVTLIWSPGNFCLVPARCWSADFYLIDRERLCRLAKEEIICASRVHIHRFLEKRCLIGAHLFKSKRKSSDGTNFLNIMVFRYTNHLFDSIWILEPILLACFEATGAIILSRCRIFHRSFLFDKCHPSGRFRADFHAVDWTLNYRRGWFDVLTISRSMGSLLFRVFTFIAHHIQVVASILLAF